MARTVLIRIPERPDVVIEKPTAEVITVVHKDTCPQCKGNRFISVVKSPNKETWVKCPACGGQGFKIRVSR